MAKRELVVRESSEDQQWKEAQKLLNKETVRKYLCEKADDMDLFMFINFCKSKHLNPFIREAYLIKYKADAPASIVTGKEAFFKRADKLQAYDGTKSGVIVRKASQIIYREGYCLFEGEKLLGGWAEVYRKDRKIPTRVEVSMAEYEGKKYNWQTKDYEVNKMWKNKPATMIVKVAEVQGLRKTFPSEFGGMFIPEESETGAQLIPQTPIDLNKIKEKKETIVEAGIVEEKSEKKEPKKDIAVEKLSKLIANLPGDKVERDETIKLLKERVGIPVEKGLKELTKEEAKKLSEIIEKQIKGEVAKQKPKEEKRVLREDEVLCVDCKKKILRKGTATYAYAMKNFKEPVCYDCGRKRQRKE